MNDFPSLKLAYGKDLKQDPKTYDKAGYVKVDFLESAEDEEGERSPWDKNALEIMNNTIRELLKMNYSYGDICILVRSNKEGNEIANSLFENKIENIVSPDSLLISASPRIGFLVNTLRFLLDNKNTIARSEILYYYSVYHLKQNTEKLHETFHDHKRSGEKKSSKKTKAETLFHGLEDNLFNEILPEQFTAHIRYLGKLPVYELCEQLISIFNLNESPDAYVQRFQDMILEYSSKSDSSLEGFIRWWDETDIADKVSVIIPFVS
jgi:ATP-dependent exoDNAse (exonuclease V) beta subunit